MMLVKISGRKNEEILTVSSRDVAVNFEKQHKHVLDSINSITAENPALIGTMFIPGEYKAGTGKSYPEF